MILFFFCSKHVCCSYNLTIFTSVSFLKKKKKNYQEQIYVFAVFSTSCTHITASLRYFYGDITNARTNGRPATPQPRCEGVHPTDGPSQQNLKRIVLIKLWIYVSYYFIFYIIHTLSNFLPWWSLGTQLVDLKVRHYSLSSPLSKYLVALVSLSSLYNRIRAMVSIPWLI